MATWANNRPNHVPTRIRQQCLQRDNHQCVATLNTGQRCPERDTAKLQAAHINQWRPGETTTVDMVRTLCTWHHSKETTKQASQARSKQRRTRPKPYHPRDQHPGRT